MMPYNIIIISLLFLIYSIKSRETGARTKYKNIHTRESQYNNANAVLQMSEQNVSVCWEIAKYTALKDVICHFQVSHYINTNVIIYALFLNPFSSNIALNLKRTF